MFLSLDYRREYKKIACPMKFESLNFILNIHERYYVNRFKFLARVVYDLKKGKTDKCIIILIAVIFASFHLSLPN